MHAAKTSSVSFSLLPFGFEESKVTQIVKYAGSDDEKEKTFKGKCIVGCHYAALLSLVEPYCQSAPSVHIESMELLLACSIPATRSGRGKGVGRGEGGGGG